MSGETEKAQHVSQPKKEKDEEEVDKYNLKSKISLLSSVKVGRFLSQPSSSNSNKFMTYIKENFGKFKDIVKK